MSTDKSAFPFPHNLDPVCNIKVNSPGPIVLEGGDNSFLIGLSRAMLTAGDGSTLVGGFKSVLKGDANSKLIGDNFSTLEGGYKSILIGGEGSILSGDVNSVLCWIIPHLDRERIYVIYVGENGIKSNTKYRWNVLQSVAEEIP